jgi:AbiJ N-terminal domain 5
MDKALGGKIITLGKRVAAKFNEGNWREIGLLTGHSSTIDTYPRLLRSLDWRDPDYGGNVLGVLQVIAEQDPKSFYDIEKYVSERFPEEGGEYVSAKPADRRRILFAPNVFAVPEIPLESDLAAVMMPFSTEFRSVYEAITRSCKAARLRCLRADDIWENSIIVQDIFNLVFRAHVVVVDFTGRNPNVMYETGIAHTLGKHVVPISQSIDDVPFDLRHHRVLKYLPNSEGLAQFQTSLTARLVQVAF